MKESCEQTLSDLQLEYLDLFLVHSPIALHPGMGTLEPLVRLLFNIFNFYGLKFVEFDLP